MKLNRGFTDLGGVIDNLICTSGEHGRGLFAKKAGCKCTVYCPQEIFIDPEKIDLCRAGLKIKTSNSRDTKRHAFCENYLNEYWICAGLIDKEMETLMAFQRLPGITQNFFLKLNPEHAQLFHGKTNHKSALNRLIKTRLIGSSENEKFIAPFWELINHNPFCQPFRIRHSGILTVDLKEAGDELFHSYNHCVSPSEQFLRYGFFSREPFIYSIPLQINLPRYSCKLIFKGLQSIRSKDRKNNQALKVTNQNRTTIVFEAFPVGSCWSLLPYLHLKSAFLEANIPETLARDVLQILQQENLNQRGKALDALTDKSNHYSDTLSTEAKKVLKYESDLIMESLNQSIF